ncbi:hypothetical protein K449DRAFT_190519 [Hypoxylon sp. EC38]|nr:hypothetical protein K449DRAFT_190519 [Hypoxylon sp. EC38]
MYIPRYRSNHSPRRNRTSVYAHKGSFQTMLHNQRHESEYALMQKQRYPSRSKKRHPANSKNSKPDHRPRKCQMPSQKNAPSHTENKH